MHASLPVSIRMGGCCTSKPNQADLVPIQGDVGGGGGVRGDVAGLRISTQEMKNKIEVSNASTSDNIEQAPAEQQKDSTVTSASNAESASSFDAMVPRREESSDAVSVTSQNIPTSPSTEPSSVELVDTQKLEEVFRKMQLPSTQLDS